MQIKLLPFFHPSPWRPSWISKWPPFLAYFAYISTSELPRELKMVAKPLFLIIWIAIKVLGELLVISLLAAILDFKMAAIFNIFRPIFRLLSSLWSSKWWQTLSL